MLAGAVSAADPLFIHMGFSIFQAYPENDRTSPLDRSSQGLVAGEGASMVVLKRYADAVKDGDRIYAVIQGIGLSNDGSGKFVLSPNPKGQILAFERAYAEAKVNPNDIEYIECHATGTPLGDITELNSMETFFGKSLGQSGTVPKIGSVKSNLGHLLTAAGMASLLKVILGMNHDCIPATLNLKQPLSSDRGKFTGEQMVQSLTPWTTATKQAAVSAFGFGGTNAHLILTSDVPATDRVKPSHPSRSLPLAIVGMDAHFGEYAGLDAFDRAIYSGSQGFRSVPPNRWKGLESDAELLKTYGFSNGEAPQGAYIQDFELDFLRFKLPPRQEEQLIPQQLLALKVSDQAIQDAGLKPNRPVAVIVAMGTELALHQFRGRCDLVWQLQQSLDQAGIELTTDQRIELEKIAKDSLHPAAQVNQYTSFIGNLMATRIAALWDFSGPAFTISAEENSTFRALEVAQLLLAAGEVEAVVISAIDLAGSFENVLFRHQQNPINSGHQTLSFDLHANGWNIGEGAGSIVVKPLDIAQQQNERIYAVIDAIALAAKPGATEDHPAATIAQTCQLAWENAAIAPDQIGYLEVCGSGVAASDAAEISGLLQAYQTPSPLTCAIGSIKANIGHTFVASGMASLIKTALCLYHRYIPSVPAWTAPQEDDRWQISPFYVPTDSQCWFLSPQSSKRIAAINSLGIDNTVAHLILSENTTTTSPSNSHLTDTAGFLLPIAAPNQLDLQSQLQSLQQTVIQGSCLKTIAHQTLHKFQTQIPADASNLPYRLAIVGSTRESILQEISLAIAGIDKAFTNQTDWKTPSGSYFTTKPLASQGQIAFVYPGMGSSELGLGRDLFRLFPALYDRFSGLTQDVGQAMQTNLVYPRSLDKPSTSLRSQHQTDFFDNGAAMCLSGISLSVLHTLVLREYFKVQPQSAFGYSLGAASSMLFALGAWRDDHNLSQTLQASPLFTTELCGTCDTGRRAWQVLETSTKFWQSHLLQASVTDVVAILNNYPKVYITFINTPQELVIAGDSDQCQQAIQALQCRAFPVSFESILHSPIGQSQYDDLVQLHQIQTHPVPNIRFYSGVNHAPMTLEQNTIAHNSAQICCQTVDFPALVRRVYEDGARIFIELGAGSACSRWIHETLQEQPHAAMSINLKQTNDRHGLLRLLAQLISQGVDLDLTPLYPPLAQASDRPRSLIKTVTLGGCRISDTILNHDNRQFFKSLEHTQSTTMQPQNTHSQSSHLQNFRILQLQMANAQTVRSSQVTQLEPAAVDQQAIVNSLEALVQSSEKQKSVIWHEADLLEFAQGEIANVFGEDYGIIDSYSRRVRLPMPPYLLVSRVTKLDAQRGEYKPCSMTTEYDIPHNATYSVDGQISWAVAVESGQCDLLLISYLGIDFDNKGKLVYRLLDCTLTFLDDLPKAGETLRYDIKINAFARNGDNLLFFFSYDCFVGDKMVLKMTGGCAGFFSDEQLAQGKGVIYSTKETQQRQQIQKQQFEPLLICNKTSFDRTDLLHLTTGNLAACFGKHYRQNQRNSSLRLPGSNFLMLDRIASVEPTGGAWGLGLIVGEKDLQPEDWYFPCHFKDDQVMAGSLMAEGCGQLLQFYMLYLGLQTCTIDARFQPIPGLGQVVRCRGQVTPTTAVLTYRMEITEIGFKPQPFGRCDVEISLNGRAIVHFKDLGLQLSEKDPSQGLDPAQFLSLAPRPAIAPRKSALINEEQVTEFCTGELAKCFGSEYAIYDQGKIKASRMPNTHLNMVSRILSVEGERHQIQKGSAIVTEYDVPLNPWYYRQNAALETPYSILMEIALQPCGFLSAYLGTTLMFPDRSLYFRNLDGKGHLVKLIDTRGKTITNRSTLLSSSNIQGMIIQSFEFEMKCEGEVFYAGTSSFGHFSPEALANQVGLDRGQVVRPWHETLDPNQTVITRFLENSDSQAKFYSVKTDRPHYRLSDHQLDLLHQVKIVPNGGQHGKGYIFAQKQVDPSDWYFKCHFQDDPVMPGSLGIEAMLQAMQVYALEMGLGKHLQSPSFKPSVDHTTTWKYRGQIPIGQADMSLEIHLTQVDVTSDRVIMMGDASLWRSKIRIYEVKSLALTLCE
jgi:PfaB family protein